MKCLIALLAALSLHAPASAEELAIGPVTVPHQFQGITVESVIRSYFSVATRQDGLYLNARMETDLRDLQTKFAALFDTIALPRDNCRSFSANNPVVSVPTKHLQASAQGALTKLSGEVKLWDCRENPIPETYWDPTGCKGTIPIINKEYVFGCPKTRPGSPIKNVLLTQPFDVSLPVYLRKTGERSAGLVLGDPDVQLGGQLAFIANGILRIADIDINAEAKKALEASIDPGAMMVTLPPAYAEFNPVIESAQLADKDGVLTATIALSARIPAEKLLEILKAALKP